MTAVTQPRSDLIGTEVSEHFRGLRVLVTGASSGLGARFAEALAVRGAHVVISGRRQQELEKVAERCQTATVITADLGSPENAGALIDQSVEALGGLDVLVNNAGRSGVTPALRESLEQTTSILGLNLLAPYELAKSAARAMRESGGGTIINVSSIRAFVSGPAIPEAAYAASKGGLVSLTRDLAVQWARYGIRVNALAPGMFRTEMTTDLTEDAEALGAFESSVPMRRVGNAEELDSALLFLADPTNTYMTGQTIIVDGGISCV